MVVIQAFRGSIVPGNTRRFVFVDLVCAPNGCSEKGSENERLSQVMWSKEGRVPDGAMSVLPRRKNAIAA
jgi:hypothetical protein